MSRIHDALKKAEEQRLANGGAPLPSAGFPPIPVFSSNAAEDPEPHYQDYLPKSELASMAIEEPTALPETFQLEQCPTTEWHPAKNALFLSATDPHAPGLEEFRSLRTKLFQMRAKRSLKTLLLSSALPGEGKSFVASNLAQALSRQAGGRTLLIDADLRKPDAHRLLGAPSSPGLVDYLDGKAKLQDIIQRSSALKDLYFIPGGEYNSHSAELVCNGRFKELLSEVGPLFSWIVIDTSPVIPISDPVHLGGACDGILLVVRAGSTPQPVAERAKQEFKNLPLLGVIFNQVSVRENPYYRYAYANYPQKS